MGTSVHDPCATGNETWMQGKKFPGLVYLGLYDRIRGIIKSLSLIFKQESFNRRSVLFRRGNYPSSLVLSSDS